MKNILKLEELAMLAISVFALYSIDAAWYWYLLMFIGPDISMLGYLAGNTTGTVMYNLFHFKVVGIALILAGYLLQLHLVLLAGIILFCHSSLDRMVGYGLKYFDGFNVTHLGTIGKGT